jgi:hypothetical protein
MPTCSSWTGSGATSHSKSSIDRKVVVTRRDDNSMASLPLANRLSSSSASTSASVGITP